MNYKFKKQFQNKNSNPKFPNAEFLSKIIYE